MPVRASGPDYWKRKSDPRGGRRAWAFRQVRAGPVVQSPDIGPERRLLGLCRRERQEETYGENTSG